MQITDKDLQQFRERAKTELQSNGAVGRLAWDAVVNALCNEVEELRKDAAPGNAASLREALEKINEMCGVGPNEVSSIAIAHICDAALAAPARNCDVGTPKELLDRMAEYCERHVDSVTKRCDQCPLYKYEGDCTLAWALEPYEPKKEGETK